MRHTYFVEPCILSSHDYSVIWCASILYFIVQNPRCENQIDELCREIEKTINHNIQNTLNTLEKDGDTIVDRIDHRISADK